MKISKGVDIKLQTKSICILTFLQFYVLSKFLALSQSFRGYSRQPLTLNVFNHNPKSNVSLPRGTVTLNLDLFHVEHLPSAPTLSTCAETIRIPTQSHEFLNIDHTNCRGLGHFGFNSSSANVSTQPLFSI